MDTIESFRNRQTYVSDFMRVLAASQFVNPESQSSNARSRAPKTNRDMKNLETIALYMVSGERGDVVASAFNEESSQIAIVLARNEGASDDDERDAVNFLNLLKQPDSGLREFIPFLVHRGLKNVQHRVNKVGDLTQKVRGTLNDGFATYKGHSSAINSILDPNEFPARGQDLKKYWIKMETNKKVYGVKNGLEKILDICMAKPIISPRVGSKSHGILHELILAAAALSQSRFFKTFVEGREYGKDDNIDEVSKFWRNLDKLGQFLDITDLIDFIKRHAPNSTIQWVPETISTPQSMQELQSIELRSVPEVIIELGRNCLNVKKTPKEVDMILQSVNRYWKKNSEKVKKKISRI